MKLSEWFENMRERISGRDDDDDDAPVSTGAGKSGGGSVSSGKKILIGFWILIIFAVGYYAWGNLITHRIDDDINFTAEPPKGGSHAVAEAAELLQRELDYGWHPSDIFTPGWVLRDNPAYQRGIKRSIERFVLTAVDQLARERGTSSQDKDLLDARSRLQFRPDANNIFGSQSSVVNYQKAVDSMRQYNRRLAAGQATYDLRADNLVRVLDGMMSDLGDSITNLERRAKESAMLFSMRGEYFQDKGLLYGDCVLMRAIGRDAEQLLNERNATAIYGKATTTMCSAAQYRPWFVINGRPDGIWPSHPYALAGAASLARAQLHEVIDVLQNQPR